jgi:hypothetical protein
MRNNNIGLYVGFSLFAIQTIASDYYRDYKMKQQHQKQIKALSAASKQSKAS